MHLVALLLGSGPNLGTAIASRFVTGGYKVAQASRSKADGLSDDGVFNIQADLSDPEAIRYVFKTTVEKVGVPNIVMYNVANRQLTSAEDPLSTDLTTLDACRRASLDSAFIAAQQALHGFRQLLSDTSTAFIYTGNTLNQIAIPGVMPFAHGKGAAAMLIEYAANAYGKDGYRFYYADQRLTDGRPADAPPSGPAHADIYWELAHEKKQTKWLVTFVKDEGRREFEGVDFDGETRASYDRMFGRV